MRPVASCLTVLSVLGTSALLHAQAVTVERQDGSYRVRGVTYEATVEEDGCLTSLQVNGVEFLSSAERIPRGAYFFQGGPLQLPEINRLADSVIEAKSDKAAIRYEFGLNSQTWTLTNATDERMVLVIVFDPAIEAFLDERGRFLKPPLEWLSETSTWFRGRQKLRIAGSTRLWGPWGQNQQIWEVRLGPNETREVTLEMGPASDQEATEAAEVASRVQRPPTDPEGPMWDLAALSAPPTTYPAEDFEQEGDRALFYEGLPFRGEPTRVFAWVGLPEMAAGERVPGMVLVHGGGGTAFSDWIRLWTSRGYAAISMDTCGCVPKGSYGNWERHELGGPPGWGGFGQIDWPREDQWTYHAVADVILAHSLLRSMPEVDPDRIGLTGISWGGYLASIVAGVDPRFKLCVPVYGCGYYLDTAFADPVTGLGEERADRWMRWWDPSAYLPDAEMPMLWVTGSNDFAYTFPALQKSYRATQGPRTLAIRLRMPHGHGGPGENPEEIHAFANSLLRDGKPLARITGQGREGSEVWATFEAEVAIAKAELNFTKDSGAWQEREWEATEAQIEGDRVVATLPEGVTVYYMNLIDERDLVVSTEHVEVAD